MRGKTALERPMGSFENNIKNGSSSKRMGGVGRINVAQDRYRWRAVLNIITNLWVP